MSYKYIDEKGEHMHTFKGQPLYGTSSVAEVLAKPLTWWASGLAVQCLGVTDPKHITLIKNKKATTEQIEAMMSSVEIMRSEISTMDVKQFYNLLDKAYRAHTTVLKDKAQEGTDLHAELERFVKDEILHKQMSVCVAPIENYNERIHPFIKWARENVEEYLWSEVNCYSEKHWIGGISDLGVKLKKCTLNNCPIKEDTIAIIDFKSSKEAYLSQFWQCCGYAIQIEENGGFDKDGNKIFELKEDQKIEAVIIVPFGMENPYPQINIDVAGGKEAFLAELLLYKKLNK